MFLQVGIMFATYLGVRWMENSKKREKPKKKKKLQLNQKIKPKQIKKSQSNGLTKFKKKESPTALEKAKHFSNVSLMAMGLLGAAKIAPLFGPVGLAVYIYAAIPYMRDVERAIVKEKRANVDVLFFTADVIAMSLGQYFTAGVGLWMMHYGKMSAIKARDDSKKLVTGIFEQLPQKVWILVEGVEIEIYLKDVQKDDIILVRSGEVIPVDGVITWGMAGIDQQALTGEAQPAEKGAGDYVHANTILITGHIRVQVDKSGEDTTAARIAKLLFLSTDSKSDVQLKGEQWADQATMPMLLTAGLVLPVLGPVTSAVFINSHIGNRIRLLAPMGTLKHISLAAQNGILVKDGRALEGLADVDTVLFDKTGTLTTGEPELVRIVPCADYSENDILSFAATAEGRQTHPIARAILKKAQEIQLTSHNIDDSKYQIGYGITVHIDEKVIRVGSVRFIKSENIPVPSHIEELTEGSQAAGNTLVLVSVDDHVAGAIEFQPQIREEIKEIIHRLRELGIKHIAIVSGDHKRPTQKLAQQLGMDEFYAEVLPEDKAKIVESLQAQNRNVCFIGDGINDAIAMKKADVSISLSGATTIATDVAEIILMDGTLLYLCDLFYISIKLNANLEKTLKLTLAPAVVNVAGAFLLNFSIITSLVINFAFSSVAVADVMKPLNTTHAIKGGEEKE